MYQDERDASVLTVVATQAFPLFPPGEGGGMYPPLARLWELAKQWRMEACAAGKEQGRCGVEDSFASFRLHAVRIGYDPGIVAIGNFPGWPEAYGGSNPCGCIGVPEPEPQPEPVLCPPGTILRDGRCQQLMPPPAAGPAPLLLLGLGLGAAIVIGVAVAR